MKEGEGEWGSEGWSRPKGRLIVAEHVGFVYKFEQYCIQIHKLYLYVHECTRLRA